MAPPRRILHCDMDSFYASVHIRDDPSLRGKPVLVGGDPSGRGVVAAASYEARKYGVHSAMPASRAKRLCPNAVFLRSDFGRYRRESEKIFEIYRRYTPLVQPMGLDEAYLDVTDHLGSFGSATAIAKEIRRRVREERKLAVSVGVGPNRLVAKIASDANKPDGLKVVRPEKVQAFLDPLPVRRLHGVGPRTEKSLQAVGIRTVRQLRAVPIDRLHRRFGARAGEWLYAMARGRDDRSVESHHERKSLSTENTFRVDLRRNEDMEGEILRMAEEVARSLERRELAGRTVTLKVRYADFTTLTRSKTLAQPTAAATVVADTATSLLRKTEAGRRPVRLLGVGMSNLNGREARQLELFKER